MRRWVLAVGCLALSAHVGAEPRGPMRWQDATAPIGFTRLWGSGDVLYGVGAKGAFRSIDNGANWKPVAMAMSANGVWGSGLDDVWIVGPTSLVHTTDGVNWTPHAVGVLSYAQRLEGMWGVGNERYVYGSDRSETGRRGAIARSKDRGTTWREEELPNVGAITGIWGSSANDIYAVGAKGVVLHTTGDGLWTAVRQGGPGLEAIAGRSATDLIAVGTGGTILHGDGKTWTTRASGVTYTLSSISFGRRGEHYVGSIEGPPLTSEDGRSWHALTAMVPRGRVWAGGDQLVVAAPGGVQFMAATASLGRPDVTPPPARITDLELARVTASRYGTEYPAARELMNLAANRLSGGAPTLPVEPALQIDRVSTCKDVGLPHRVAPAGASNLIVDVECACTDGTPTIARATTSIWHDKKKVGEFTVGVVDQIAWCANKLASPADEALALTPIKAHILEHLPAQRDKVLENELATARLEADRVDTYARYVLDGGASSKAYLQLARLIGRPYTWRGFFWNDPGVHKVTSCSERDTIRTAEDKGDEQVATGHYSDALRYYDIAAFCEPRATLKAYAVACKLEQFPDAKKYFGALPLETRKTVAGTCIRHGFDPN